MKFQITNLKSQTISDNQIQKSKLNSLAEKLSCFEICDLEFGVCLDFGA